MIFILKSYSIEETVLMGNKLGRKRQIVDERYTKPQQGLYMSKDVDIKKLKKLILESKLAPCYPGHEESSCHHDLEECPICFLVCILGSRALHSFLLYCLN